MATLDEIEKLLDKKLVLLRQQITDDIKESIEQNRRNIAGNAATLDGHTEQLETLKEQQQNKIDDLQELLTKQNNEIDDLTNRTMRNNIVIKGLPEGAKEDTKKELCDYLASLSLEDPRDIYQKIDRAHRPPGEPPEDGKPRNIFANLIRSVDCKYYVDLNSKHCAKHKQVKNPIRVDRQYTKQVQDRRNLAMIERKQLLADKKYATCHLAYPAKLFGKVDIKQQKNEFIKEF